MKKLITAYLLPAICFFFSVSIVAGDDSSGYSGSESCQTCHEEIYELWQSSKHASIFTSGQDNIQKCNACHTTVTSNSNLNIIENNVSCEACHGPGEEHILSEGDPVKIVSSNSADICGRCHNGNRPGDDIQHMFEYRPGMKLSDIKGLKLIPVAPDEIPPYYEDVHPSLTYNMWLASGHAETPDRNMEVGGNNWEGPVTCTACHNPHYSKHSSQLKTKADDLCRSCHFQGDVLKGFGAKGIEETRSLHTAAPCISCHMTEKNHLMKMLRPDDPDLSETRLDSCSACHEVKDRKMRGDQLLDMEAWYNETMEPVQKDLKFIEDRLMESPNILNKELKTTLEDIRDNLSIIINDGSNGVHNLDYALEIMYLAKKQLKEIKKTIE